MATATITPEGYIDIPKEILDQLHLHAGDKLDIEMEQNRNIRMRPKTLRPSEVAGRLASKTNIKLSIEEMDEAIAEAAGKREP